MINSFNLSRLFVGLMKYIQDTNSLVKLVRLLWPIVARLCKYA